MKQKKYIYFIILLFVTATGLWIVPSLVNKATYKPDNYPFMYYSSVLGELCFVDFSDKEQPMRDMSGNVYDQAQFDSLLPLLNYRQLMSDGRMPDSIGGYAVTMQLLRVYSVMYRYNPSDIDMPQPGLHIMYEAMPKRVGISATDDVFRFKDKMEFIVANGNYVDSGKSDMFNKELGKKGFEFPAQGVWGNPNPRKPYDEGYFCLDSKGDLFHIKMVNGRPFVKDTGVGKAIDIKFFAMHEVATKRYYGYIYDKTGNVYILEAADGGYIPTKLDIEPLDMTRDRMTIMGNMLYWTVTVTRPDGMDCYALDCADMKRIEDHHVDREPGKWDRVSEYLFPYYITLTDKNSYYVYPRLQTTGFYGLITNVVLAVCALFVFRKRSAGMVFPFVYVALTGIAGFVAMLLLPAGRKNRRKPAKVGIAQPTK